MSGITGELTAQRIFDHVAAHLLKQGHAAMRKSSKVCQYLTCDGEQCAVGCLFSSGEYKADMEHMSVHELAREGKLPFRFLSYLYLLTQLQAAHDKTLAKIGMPAWVRGMNEIACSRGLSAEVLEVNGDRL